MGWRGRVSAGIAALAVAGALAGCGSSGSSGSSGGSHSPSQILSEAVAAVKAVHSYRITGTGIDSQGSESMTLEVGGPNALSAVVTRPSGTTRLITSGAYTYIKAPRSFWRSQPGVTAAAVAALSGRWLKVAVGASSQLTKAMSMIGNPGQIARCWQHDDIASLSYVGHSTVGGVPVVVLHNTGAAPGSAPGTVDVATTNPKLPVKWTVTGARKPGGPVACGGHSTVRSETATFGDFNQSFDIHAPADALLLSSSAGNIA